MNYEKEDQYIRMKKVDTKPYDFKEVDHVKLVEEKQFGTGALWNNTVIAAIAVSNNVSAANIEKFKKSKAFKEVADQKVTDILANIHTNPQFASDYANEIDAVMGAMYG